MPYHSFQMAAKYLTQVMGLLSNADRSAGPYSGNSTERINQIVQNTNKMVVRAANLAIEHIKTGIEKLDVGEGTDEENSW